MKAIAFIFARGGSKGLPNKNIIDFHGKPLIAWAIEAAKAVNLIQEVYVSTDSNEIADIALQYGAKVPFIRPTELAADDSPEILSWRHAITYLRDVAHVDFDTFISIPVTAPLRSANDIENCISKYADGGYDLVLGVSESKQSPYFNMVHLSEDGLATICMPSGDGFSRRQDVPKVYDITTVSYVTSVDYVLGVEKLMSGIVGGVIIPYERSIDIDDIYDLKLAEIIYSEKLLGNSFDEN